MKHRGKVAQSFIGWKARNEIFKGNWKRSEGLANWKGEKFERLENWKFRTSRSNVSLKIKIPKLESMVLPRMKNNFLQSQRWRVEISKKARVFTFDISHLPNISIQIILNFSVKQISRWTQAFFNNNWTSNRWITEIWREYSRSFHASMVFLEWPRAKLAKTFYRNRGASDFSRYSSLEIRARASSVVDSRVKYYFRQHLHSSFLKRARVSRALALRRAQKDRRRLLILSPALFSFFFSFFSLPAEERGWIKRTRGFSTGRSYGNTQCERAVMVNALSKLQPASDLSTLLPARVSAFP